MVGGGHLMTAAGWWLPKAVADAAAGGKNPEESVTLEPERWLETTRSK